ncbi:MAG TPA: hypothetical protein VF403_16230 [Kofleriaceae bacterium]
MKRPLALTTMLVLWSALAFAAPHRVTVLPIDGDADPALRKQLGGVVMQLAKTSGGTITAGDTTFADVATAVGCDPHTPACADTVLSTLGVDEIVYGSAFVGGGQTTVVVSRVEKGQPRRDQTVSITAGAKADSAEPTLRPLFDLPGTPTPTPEPVGSAGSVSDATDTGSGSAEPAAVAATAPSPPGDEFFATRERKIGFGFVAGGALVLVIGFALWASESSQQSQINDAPTNSSADIKNLLALEDRASSYAWEGNIAVVLGLAAGGVGTYYLVKDHQMRATVTPIDHGTGAAVLLGGRW